MNQHRETRTGACVLALAAAVALASAYTPVARWQARSSAPTATTAAANASAPAEAEKEASAEGPRLIFEREVFLYPGANRRDPFNSLGREGSGPMFEELSLRMIIFSDAPDESIAVLADGSKASYRLRRGEALGNATIVEITPKQAVFVVEDYGSRRRETLELRPEIPRGEEPER